MTKKRERRDDYYNNDDGNNDNDIYNNNHNNHSDPNQNWYADDDDENPTQKSSFSAFGFDPLLEAESDMSIGERERILRRGLRELKKLQAQLWFLERCWNRFQFFLRAEERREIEDMAPEFLLWENIQQEEIKKKAPGPSTFIKVKAWVGKDDDAARRTSTRLSTKKSGLKSMKSVRSGNESITSQRLDTNARMRWVDKVENLTTEIRIVKGENAAEMVRLGNRKRRLKLQGMEHQEHLKDLNVTKDRFQIVVVKRGSLSPSGNLLGLEQTIVTRYKAQVLRGFHKDSLKAMETKRDILRLGNQNLKRLNNRLDDLIFKKRDNKMCYTQNDKEKTQVEAEELSRENVGLDSDLKACHQSQNDAIFKLRSVEKILNNYEEKRKALTKEMDDRKEILRKMIEAREVISQENESLEREIDDHGKMTRDFRQIDLMEYVAVTSKNKRLSREIKAMEIKVKLAQLHLKSTQAKLRNVQERKSELKTRSVERSVSSKNNSNGVSNDDDDNDNNNDEDDSPRGRSAVGVTMRTSSFLPPIKN